MLTLIRPYDILSEVEVNSTKHFIERRGRMIDYTELNNRIEESGVKKNVIAKQLGITSKTLFAKLNGKSEFTISQVVRLSSVLHLTYKEMSNIFFSKWVE